MNEQEWLTCTQPMAMMYFLERQDNGLRRRCQRLLFRSRTPFRRVYLAACGIRRCCWPIWLGETPSKQWETEEKFAEGLLTLEALLADDPARCWRWPNPWRLLSNIIRSSPEADQVSEYRVF